MGMTPLSIAMMTRGKSVFGKTATGMLNARYAPTTAKLMVKNKIGRDKRLNHGHFASLRAVCASTAVWPELRSMPSYSLSLAAGFSVAASGLEDLPAESLAAPPSAGGAASILILVPSGKAYPPAVMYEAASLRPH